MDADDYEGIHGFGNRNKEGELLLGFGSGHCKHILKETISSG